MTRLWPACFLSKHRPLFLSRYFGRLKPAPNSDTMSIRDLLMSRSHGTDGVEYDDG